MLNKKTNKNVHNLSKKIYNAERKYNLWFQEALYKSSYLVNTKEIALIRKKIIGKEVKTKPLFLTQNNIEKYETQEKT